jgi:hypothetical protein
MLTALSRWWIDSPIMRMSSKSRVKAIVCAKAIGSSHAEEKEMIGKNPPEDVAKFVTDALNLYLHVPERPQKASAHDRQTAANLHFRGISLATIESALLLASVRRLTRPPI